MLGMHKLENDMDLSLEHELVLAVFHTEAYPIGSGVAKLREFEW